jgi:hypothetical protein
MRWRWRIFTKGHDRHVALAARHRQRDGGAGSATDPAGAVIDQATF